MSFLVNFFITFLIFLHNFIPSLGFVIILFTLVVRTVLLVVTFPSLKSMEKIKSLKGEVEEMKQKYKKDPKALQLAQVALYKKHNINPLAGCLPQILQIIILIALYRALMSFVGSDGSYETNNIFFWLDLSKPDPLFILPTLALITQLIFSIMLAPGAETPDIISNKSKNKNIIELNKKEENTASMAATMQKQMMFMMPAMTFLFALSFPSGLTLYWVMSTIYSLVQQYFISGLGGLKIYLKRANLMKQKKEL